MAHNPDDPCSCPMGKRCEGECTAQLDARKQRGDDKVLVFRTPGTGQPVVVPTEVAKEATRAVRAWDLHKSGKTWVEIAQIEGYLDARAAQYDVELWKKEAVAIVADASRRDWLALQVERYNTLLSYTWPAAQQGNIPAINSAVGIISQQSKLLALESAVAEGEGEGGPKTVIVPPDDQGYLEALEGMG